MSQCTPDPARTGERRPAGERAQRANQCHSARQIQLARANGGPPVSERSERTDGHSERIEIRPRSPLWSQEVVEDIWAKATLGRYRITGGATRRRVPCLDDLTFVP